MTIDRSGTGLIGAMSDQGIFPLTVGFIGVGHMGNPMAHHILKAGHAMTVYDIHRDKARNLEDAGACWAGSPLEVAARSEVVLTSLPGPS